MLIIISLVKAYIQNQKLNVINIFITVKFIQNIHFVNNER